MADLSHVIGGDLALGPTGDLGLVDGRERGTQRVLRRLLTNQGDYLWHLDYGAGLPARVGGTDDETFIQALVQSQIFLEPAVARDPAPIVTAVPILNGVFVRIQYWDTGTGLQQTLSFEVT